MAEKNELVPEAGTKQLEIVRTFDAPRELVFRAFTEAEHLAHWWGPKGSRIQVVALDLRPGGIFHYKLTAPDGTEMWGKFVYREITAPERLVYISAFADKDGVTTRDPFGIGFPHEILNVLTLTEQQGRTTLTLTGQPVNATDNERQVFESLFASMNEGFDGTLEQLRDYLINITQ